ncbi:MAG: site-specific integrase [Actinomycetia bacterium]|nr:site-specific integrase [Actinomycetes bacterium]MCP4961255.1 site-specific integrase [Actinomycetes bacterium]
MRRGEALGLRWRDLDLDSGDLRITQTIVTISYTPQFDTPKTKRSRRSIYLDHTTVDELRRHRLRQKEERLALGEAWMNDGDLVFTDELGRPLHPDKVTRAFRAHVREADLRSIRLHDLRHTYATLALKAGVHPKVVSDRLGHATTGITLDLYSHVTPGIGREAADLVADRIFGRDVV